MVDTPRALRGPIAPQAWPISCVLMLGAAAMLWLDRAFPSLGFAAPACGLLGALALANLAFFRNPRRTAPPGDGLVLAPADGRVVEVAEVEDPEGFVGPSLRVAIFLSIFNVHVNRAPVSGKVRAVRRAGTDFRAAFRSDASQRNVRLRLDLETPGGARVGLVQITGLIARRIVCYAAEGDQLERGAPYGLICYGSRVEVYLPPAADVRVRVGDRVRGGSSVLAEVRA